MPTDAPTQAILTFFGCVGLMCLIAAASRLREQMQESIPTPEENERRQLKVAEQCSRHNERLERNAAKDAWAELRPRVIKAIASNVRVEISPSKQRHLDYFNAEIGKRGWVLIQDADYGGGEWYRAKPLNDLPIPASTRTSADNLPLIARQPQ